MPCLLFSLRFSTFRFSTSVFTTLHKTGTKRMPLLLYARPFLTYYALALGIPPEPDLPRPKKAAASVPTFCGRDYGRDVVLLCPAVHEANRRDLVVPRACPCGSTRLRVCSAPLEYGAIRDSTHFLWLRISQSPEFENVRFCWRLLHQTWKGILRD